MKHKWRAWAVLFTALAAGISIAAIQNKVVPCIEVLQTDFGISKGIAGWLSSVFCIVGILISLPSAVIVEKNGARKTCLIALASVIAGSIIGLMTNSVAFLMISRVIEGIGAGLISIAVPVLITIYFPVHKRGLPTGIWSSWQFLGQTGSFLLGVTMLGAYGWREIWAVGALCAAACFFLCILFVKEPCAEQPCVESRKKSFFWKKVFQSRELWRVSVAMLSFCFACFGFVTWITSYWNEVLGLEIALANQYVSLFGIISLPAVMAAGKLLDCVDRRKFAIFSAIAYTIMVSVGLSMISTKLLPVFVILYPVFDGGISTSLMTLVPQCIDDVKQIPAAVAVFTAMSNVGMLVGPPVIGSIAEHYGWKQCAGALMLAGVVVVIEMLRIRPCGLEKGEKRE